jgi:predicted nucleic acid-binding protein
VTVVADTGALYALVDASDVWHTRVADWWTRNTSPIVVPTVVLPEVAYLLQTRIGPRAEIAFIRAVADGEFTTEPVEPDDFDRVLTLMDRYADFPLGFVDAAVIALAERLEAREILTTDRRHFGSVRPQHTRALVLVP